MLETILYSPVTLGLGGSFGALMAILCGWGVAALLAPKPPQAIRDHRMTSQAQKERNARSGVEVKVHFRELERQWVICVKCGWEGEPQTPAGRLPLVKHHDDGSHTIGYIQDLSHIAVEPRFRAMRLQHEQERRTAWAFEGTMEAHIVGESPEDRAQDAFMLDPLESWVDPALAGADDEETTIALDLFDTLVATGDITLLGALGAQVPGEMPVWGSEDDAAFREFSDQLMALAA